MLKTKDVPTGIANQVLQTNILSTPILAVLPPAVAAVSLQMISYLLHRSTMPQYYNESLVLLNAFVYFICKM